MFVIGGVSLTLLWEYLLLLLLDFFEGYYYTTEDVISYIFWVYGYLL